MNPPEADKIRQPANQPKAGKRLVKGRQARHKHGGQGFNTPLLAVG